MFIPIKIMLKNIVKLKIKNFFNIIFLIYLILIYLIIINFFNIFYFLFIL